MKHDLFAAIFIAMFINTFLSVYHYFRLSKKIANFEKTVMSFHFMAELIDTIEGKIEDIKKIQKKLDKDSDRILEGIKRVEEFQKPKPTNNWENLKKAFNSPAKGRINERD